MITSSYSASLEYISDVEKIRTESPYFEEEQFQRRITPATSGSTITDATPYEPVIRNEAPQILNPDFTGSYDDGTRKENLSIIPVVPDEDVKGIYIAHHTSSGINADPRQGWTEEQYADIENAGGFVRTVILSGSYAELRKLRVDSEINTETISTSWSASVGENLRVGNNAGVAGYFNIGDTASLLTGSGTPGHDPTHSFAPNDEGISDLRLIVSDSALISSSLYVKDSASVSGGLDVKGDTRLASNLYVTGNAEISESLAVSGNAAVTGNVNVIGNEAVTGSLHVSSSIYGSENFYLTGNAEISGNLQVEQNAAITGSLHVSKSIYGSENLYITGNTEISGNLQVEQNAAITGSLHVSSSIYGSENFYLTGNQYVDGNSYLSGNVEISSALRVDGRTELGMGEGAGLFVSGPITASGDLIVEGDGEITNFTIHKDLVVEGSCSVFKGINVSGSLFVGKDGDGILQVFNSSYFEDDVNVYASAYIQENLKVEEDLTTRNAIVSESLEVQGTSSFGDNATFRENVLALKDVQIEGNLVVNGTASYFNVGSLYVEDKSITVASGAASPSAALGAGFDIEGANVEFHYKYPEDRMDLNKGLDIQGDTNITGSLTVTDGIRVEGDQTVNGNLNVSENLYLTGSAEVSGNLGVVGDVDIKSSHFSMSKASIIDGVATIEQAVNTTNLSASNLTETNYLYVGESASISLARITQSYISSTVITHSVVQNEIVTSSVVLTQSVYQSIVQSQTVTSSIVLTQSVSSSTVQNQIVTSSIVLTQSVTLQDVVTQSVVSSSVSQLSILSASVQDINITSGSANVFTVEQLIVDSTQPSIFQGDVVVEQNISGSHSASFKDLSVENNAQIGNALYITGNNGTSLTVESGAINARNSDLTTRYIASTEISASQITGSFYGDGSKLTGITASIVDVTTYKAEFEVPAGNEKTIYRFTHNLETENVLIQVYQTEVDFKYSQSVDPGLAIQIFPEQVAVFDENRIDIVFGRAPINGYVVVAKAGHVIKQSEVDEDWLVEKCVHWGTTGSWTADVFAADTMSAEVVIASASIDVPKIGNKTTGPQYYSPGYEDSYWESYIEFNKASIDSYVQLDGIPMTASVLDQNGNLTIRGNLTTDGTFNTSDIREKTNIRPVENALEAIKQIEGVRFDWKNNSGSSIGVIAQNVAAIYPELTKVSTNLDGKETMTVNYNGLVGVLIEAVKVLAAKVEELENRTI